MNTKDLRSKLFKIHQNAAAFKLSKNVMDKKEFNDRINRIISDLEEVMEDVKGLKLAKED